MSRYLGNPRLFAQLNNREANHHERGRVSKTTSWLQLSLDIWRASLEAQQVIGLRLAKLTSGGAVATAEMNRMVSEKVDAAFEAQYAAAKSMLTGKAAQIPSQTLTLYRQKMRANRRRLGAAKPLILSRPRRSKKRPLI